MNNKYEKKKFLNFIEYNINFMENILYTISHRKRKNNKISENRFMLIIKKL